MFPFGKKTTHKDGKDGIADTASPRHASRSKDHGTSDSPGRRDSGAKKSSHSKGGSAREEGAVKERRSDKGSSNLTAKEESGEKASRSSKGSAHLAARDQLFATKDSSSAASSPASRNRSHVDSPERTELPKKRATPRLEEPGGPGPQQAEPPPHADKSTGKEGRFSLHVPVVGVLGKVRAKPAGSARSRGSGAASTEVLDGAKLRSLLKKDEAEFDSFLETYFDLLDKNSDGSLTKQELRPALLRFGELVGMPPAGSTQEMDERTDTLFKNLMSTDLSEDVDKTTFVNISRNFLTAVAQGLEEKPLVLEAYDFRVLRELAENEDLFDSLADDFFTEFDVDGSEALTRDEIAAALVALGLVPPQGARPDVDALLARIVGKYAGEDMELQRDEFKLVLRDLLKDLAEELSTSSAVVRSDALPMLSAGQLSSAAEDAAQLRSFADAAFSEWDTLGTGRLAQSDVQKGVRDLFAAYHVPVLQDELAPTMNLAKCLFMSADTDDTGFVERDEFDSLMKEVLLMLSGRLKVNPEAAAAVAATTSQTTSAWVSSWFYSTSSYYSSAATTATVPATAAATAATAAATAAAPATAAGSAKATGGSERKGVTAGLPPIVVEGMPEKAAPAPAPRAAAAPASTTSKGRSAAEIRAAYNHKPSDAVIKAREKLEERQRKLREMADKSEELDAEANEFEDLGKQLAEKMKTRWW